ncbi:hypothetical protein [Mucilaginibacter sp. SP1R1]|uniref:hypothetical protein n=1 Tax=Mucilaginibacter sp. SP1R1 TaxID=2723091 RepID=UPI00160FB52E|nr:hypothetical protein [Mucilaginibacter sp. SP1R1]MBB6147835.1 hypothetical protein [Mucilaginibacter sp. SP1R1]
MSLFFCQYLKAQKITGSIVLNNDQLAVLPKEFYIAAVVDDRDDRNAVAWLLPFGTATATSAKYPVDLKGGTLAAIRQFIDVAMPANKGLRPVVMHIKTFRLDETLLPTGYVEGKLKVSLSFDLQKPDQLIYLTDYNGSADYNRRVNQDVDVKVVLRRALEYGLNNFNSWINREAATNVKLAKGVKIYFTEYTERPEGDTIYYSPQRPLQWADFMAKPMISRFGASVLPGVGYNEDVTVDKGIVMVHLSMKVYLPKSACWVKADSRNGYSLNHEQRHFDIVKIISERFKQKLKAEKLTIDNYDGPISVQYLEILHEMNVMQDQYDGETGHGMNTAIQQQWNERIDKELGSFK